MEFSEVISKLSIDEIIRFWEAKNASPVTLKTGRKERFVLIQDRSESLYELFDGLKQVGIPSNVVKENLIRIVYCCISPSSKSKKRIGWFINVCKAVSDVYNGTYEDDIEYRNLLGQAKTGTKSSIFKCDKDQPKHDVPKHITEPKIQKAIEKRDIPKELAPIGDSPKNDSRPPLDRTLNYDFLRAIGEIE